MKNFLIPPLAFLLTVTLFGCSHFHTHETEQVELNQVENLLPDFNAARYNDIYFSGQPPLDQLDGLKELGFANIINLRQPMESGYEANVEEANAINAGLNYTHIPLKGNQPLTDEKIAEITAAVVKNRQLGKTLVHCSSGNRAALWLGGHFYKDHGVSKEDAYKIATQAGLNKETPMNVLKNYLEMQESPSPRSRY